MSRFDDEEREALRTLTQSGVGRRWLLKAGLTTAAATALLSTIGRIGAVLADPAPEGDIAPEFVDPTDDNHTLHFALGPAQDLDDLVVIANGRRIPLIPHTPLSRRRMLRDGTLWRKIRRGALTHYAVVPRPRKRAMLFSVSGKRDGVDVVAAQYIHAPLSAMRALAKIALAHGGRADALIGTPGRLAMLGLKPRDITTVAEVIDLDSVVDYTATAAAFTFCHPSVATIDSVNAAATKGLLHGTPEVVALGNEMRSMHAAGKNWATNVQAVDANGQPAQIKVGTITTGFSTFTLTDDTNFRAAARTGIVSGIQGVRDTGSLGVVIDKPLDESPPDTATWHQPQGVVLPPMEVGTTDASAVQAYVQNTGTSYGTITSINSSSGGQVNLTLYNNFVRWIWVYVQYLSADGTNLSENTSAKFPDTQYCQSLGLLPQVFTLLGVPLFGTNHINVNLNFPPDAVAARLLYCGLGNAAVDGGWRQWFPADAYPDHVAPQAEVLCASLLTALLTIGISAFALASDIQVATTFAAVRQAVESEVPDLAEVITDTILSNTALSPAEAFAALVGSGGATYEDLANNNANVQNIWSILVNLSSVIPKLIFSPGGALLWSEIGAILLAEEAASKLVDLLIFVGEIFAAIAAVGDAVTLAEALAESAATPWVIPNQVSLTYTATVTIKHDPRDSVWPATARSWKLEANLDGTISAASLTAQFNANGNESADIVQTISVPYGSKTITWTFVTLDADGQLVGTGTSGQLTNSDSNNVPTNVSFAITELPAPIDTATVFERAITTAYTASSGGYTWQTAATDPGTITDPAVQDIVGITVATRLGVVGYTWKQNNQYWIRGVPIAENGTSVNFGTATQQAYVRPPYLLFDTFVGDKDTANHVLVEPNDTDDGYTIRSISLDPATGNITWDPTQAAGAFPMPVSAVALHSSGKVVAIHTDSGRIGHLIPAITPIPPLAAYAAGSGTTTGLLSSPVALAITNPGVVIVIEAGANQLSAFDLNANPLPYFAAGSGKPLAYKLPLPTGRTWLDIAVDGAAQIYLLSYEGDGSQVGDYRIDVYAADGTPVVTNSPGTNLARFSVDYWRSIFGANFTALINTATNKPRVDPALGVFEPSISRLDPNG